MPGSRSAPARKHAACQAAGIAVHQTDRVDSLMLTERLPKRAVRAQCDAVVASLCDRRWASPRALCNRALLQFEAAVARSAGAGVRPALLFAERDRIVVELRRFLASRLASRLRALAPARVRAGRAAAPFDALVLGGDGARYAIVLRRLPERGRRLHALHAIRTAAARSRDGDLAAVVVYDFAGGRTYVLRALATRRVRAA